MSSRTSFRLFTGAVTLLAGLTLAGTATAQASTLKAPAVQAKLVVSGSERMSPAEVATAVQTGKLAPVALNAATMCWSARGSWSTYYGNYWFKLSWCSDGSRVTTSTYSGEGSQPLNGATGGQVAGDWNNNVGWETRTALEFRFLYYGTYYYECGQVRGGATGLYSTQQSCNLN